MKKLLIIGLVLLFCTTVYAGQKGGFFATALPQDLDTTDEPTFANAIFSDLAPSQLVKTNAGSGLDSAALGNFVSGTAKRVTVTDGADGAITLSGPQDIDQVSTPVFNSVVINGTAPDQIVATGSSGSLEAIALSNFVSAGSNITVTDTANGGISVASSSSSTTNVRNISVINFMNKRFDLSGEGTTPEGLDIVNSGQDMMVLDGVTDIVSRYSLGTAYDVSTATYTGQNIDLTSDDSATFDVVFDPTGVYMYVTGDANDSVYQYELSPAYQIATASLVNSYDMSASSTDPDGIHFNSTGTNMYIMDDADDRAYRFVLSTPWMINSTSAADAFCYVNAQEASGAAALVYDDILYVLGNADDGVNVYSLPTPGSPASCSFSFLGPKLDEGVPRGMRFDENGYYLYVVGTGNKVYQYLTNMNYTAN